MEISKTATGFIIGQGPKFENASKSTRKTSLLQEFKAKQTSAKHHEVLEKQNWGQLFQ